MIEQLRISGVGVIDTAQMDLSPRFTVITGETGAGKTMVLTALRLLIGEKAQADLVREGHRQIEVDGVFIPSDATLELLDRLGLEVEDELIVSRTVPAQGRSRAVAQGRPVPQQTLRDLVGPLITIHGQSDQWRVRREGVQRELLDLYAGPEHQSLLAQYRSAWASAVEKKERLDRLHSERDQREIEVRYLVEVIGAVEALDPLPGEETSLNQQIDRFDHVAQLSDAVMSSLALLRGGDESYGAADSLGQAVGVLRQLGAVDSDLDRLADRLSQVEAEVLDVAGDLRDYLGTLEDDPVGLARLHQRRSDLEGLMKGRATTAQGLLDWLQDARSRLEELTGADADPEKVVQELESAKAEVLRLGAELSASRKNAGEILADSVNGELGALAMPGAKLRARLEKVAPGPFGLDRVSLDLKARQDGPFRPIGESASGGEISRVMLALELVLGQRKEPGTYVFDEVDQGVGGHTATEVGRRLERLSQSQQVIAVTHLPQVAAFADRHFVLRRDGENTSVGEVSGGARVEEVMRMMGADQGSVSGRRHAEELLAEKHEKIVPGANPEGQLGERD